MTEKNEQTKVGATELTEEELEKAQGAGQAVGPTMKGKQARTRNNREAEDDVIVDGNIITADNYDAPS